MSDTSRVIRIEDISSVVPAAHYDLSSRRIAGALGSQTMAVSQASMRSTGYADPHVHANAEQLFIVLKGEMGLRIGSDEFRLKAGDAALIRPGETHENFNVFDGETQYLTVTVKVPAAVKPVRTPLYFRP
jgi:quercetin dioxygenase-like cupin family protein